MQPKITEAEVETRIMHSGGWEVAAIVESAEGEYRKAIVYYGYGKLESIRRFLAEVNEEEV